MIGVVLVSHISLHRAIGYEIVNNHGYNALTFPNRKGKSMPHHAQLPLWDDKSDSEKLDTLHQMILDLQNIQVHLLHLIVQQENRLV